MKPNLFLFHCHETFEFLIVQLWSFAFVCAVKPWQVLVWVLINEVLMHLGVSIVLLGKHVNIQLEHMVQLDSTVVVYFFLVTNILVFVFSVNYTAIVL